MENKNNCLIKLNSVEEEQVYVNPSKIVAIRNNVHFGWRDSRGKNRTGCTEILVNGTTLYIQEHIAEVIAILSGRNPGPAKVLFGKNNE